MTIEEINAMDADTFVVALGWIFEESPWVAHRAWAAHPFADRAALHQAMVAEVERAPSEQQLALVRAHPDLGTRARVSEASQGEQAGAGLDRLTPAEFERLQSLNTQYRDKFGFPFLFAVKGSTSHEILDAMETRLRSTPEHEFREALRQVYRIAGFRLETMAR